METYTPIVFLHDYEDETVAAFFDDKIDEGTLIHHLAQWDYGEGEHNPEPSHGTSDYVTETPDGYQFCVNRVLGYVGLDRINK